MIVYSYKPTNMQYKISENGGHLEKMAGKLSIPSDFNENWYLGVFWPTKEDSGNGSSLGAAVVENILGWHLLLLAIAILVMSPQTSRGDMLLFYVSFSSYYYSNIWRPHDYSKINEPNLMKLGNHLGHHLKFRK